MELMIGMTPYLYKVFPFCPLAKAGRLYNIVFIHPQDVAQNPSWVAPDMEGDLIFVNDVLDVALYLEAICTNDNVNVSFTRKQILDSVINAMHSGERSQGIYEFICDRAYPKGEQVSSISDRIDS